MHFRCPCGFTSPDLGAFHDHALPCRARRSKRQQPAQLYANSPAGHRAYYAEEQRRKNRERMAELREKRAS